MNVCMNCNHHYNSTTCPHCLLTSKPMSTTVLTTSGVALSVLLGVGMVACESPQALYGVPESVLDLDGDGFDNFEDCDDEDPYTYPGAAIEDSETACMTDFDGDGYGDSTPEGNVEPGTDCNDLEPTINPSNGTCD